MSSFEASASGGGKERPAFRPAGPGDPARGGFVAGELVGRPGEASEAEAVPEPAPSVEEREQAAYARGVAEGRAALPWEEADELKRVATTLREAVEEVQALRADYLKRHRGALIDLALAIAEKLLRRDLSGCGTTLTRVLDEALARLDEEDGPVELHLADGDHEVLAAGMASELADWVAAHAIDVKPDEDLSNGDFRLAGTQADVDGRLASLLRDLRESLVEAIQTAEAEGDVESPGEHE